MSDETTVANEATTEDAPQAEAETTDDVAEPEATEGVEAEPEAEGHDLETRKGRLASAIEKHGPGQRTLRDFHRTVRHHVRGVTGSFHAVDGYVNGDRLIPDGFMDAAAMVLGPTTSAWLKWGDNPPEPDTEGVDDVEGEGEDPPPPEDDVFADIRNTVNKAGRRPGDEALRALDPMFPRRGQTIRNWGILHSVVHGRAVAEVATEVGLSPERVQQIVDEYAKLVRAATGTDA